jgi:glycosyltransferase involved in cell wall biosynthesis
MEPHLNILISTCDDRIEKVKEVILDYRADVRYIISHQYSEEKYQVTPPELMREDILVSHIPGKGVTRSRNHALRLATAPISLFADDDVRYTHDYFDRVIAHFKQNEALDVALFQIKTRPGEPPYKIYPNKSFQLKGSLPYYISTVEIACRTDRIKQAAIRFDERFGAGQPLLVGSEDSIFIHDCLKKGLTVRFFPEYVVEHPYESTIKSLSPFDMRRTSMLGAYDARIHGRKALGNAYFTTLKYLPKLLRYRKNPFHYLQERLSAVRYILTTNHRVNNHSEPIDS